MNKYYDEYMHTIHTPAIKASIGDLTWFIGHIDICVQPNLNTMCEADSYALTEKEEFSLMIKRLSKKF